MTTCAAVNEVVELLGDLPRSALPEWCRNPRTDEEVDLALAVALTAMGAKPVCRKGKLRGWRGVTVLS